MIDSKQIKFLKVIGHSYELVYGKLTRKKKSWLGDLACIIYENRDNLW
ncbi:MAG: hypothetical protein WC667_11120 [Sulfurimonas sp.]